MSQKFLDALGVDPSQMQDFAAAVVHNAFFEKMAEYGVQPRTQAEAAKMLESANMLMQHEAKTAAAASTSRIDRTYALLTGATKAASASPVAGAQLQQAEVLNKTAAYLADPETFAYALSLRAMTRQA